MRDHLPEIDLSELANCRLRNLHKPVSALVFIALAGAGLSAVGYQFAADGSRRFMLGYLVAFAFVLSISLGSLFFVLVQHQFRAGWSVVVRRLSEFFCLNILVVAVLFLPIGWSVWSGNGLIYNWSKTEAIASNQDATNPKIQPASFKRSEHSDVAETIADHGTGHAAHKPYLNRDRFLFTWTVLFLFWISVSVYYYRNSVAQDSTGDLRRTLNMEWWSGIALLLFAFSLTFAAFDLLMMLDSTWYSTIFGVYYFAGSAVAAFATLLLCVLLLKTSGLAPNVFSEEAQRDLGRLTFAFVFFWAYIAFSQYMLLWYANMPETTGWLVRHGMSTATGYTNSWGWLAVALLFAHFLIPFAGIMSRHVKENSKAMIFWTIWILIAHYLDLYWIVMPEISSGFTISLIEIGTGLAVVAVYGLAAIWIASRSNLFAVGDPRMHESLTRQAMY